MIFEPLAHAVIRPSARQSRELALDSAIVFRVRSLDHGASAAERHDFRVLMRRQALIWRRAPATTD